MKKNILSIVNKACWGCKACEVACKQENQTPIGVRLIHIEEIETRNSAGILDFLYRVQICIHCQELPCAAVCPVDAFQAREDGIVVLDEQSCNGCGLCVDACPEGAIIFNTDRGVALKCNLCHHRVDQGLIPACADQICPARCIYFGDPAEIAEAKRKRTEARRDA